MHFIQFSTFRLSLNSTDLVLMEYTQYTCNYFSGQVSYYATHMLGLNFTMKSELNLWRLWVSLCTALTWSELNYTAWFDGVVCKQPALVCHGPHRRGATLWGVHRVNFHWTCFRFSTCGNLKSFISVRSISIILPVCRTVECMSSPGSVRVLGFKLRHEISLLLNMADMHRWNIVEWAIETGRNFPPIL